MAEHVLSWAISIAPTRDKQNEVWDLVSKYHLELWRDYPSIVDKPVRVERLKMGNLGLPDHYPQFVDGKDIFIASDWRMNSTIVAAFRPDKDAIVIYPRNKKSVLLGYPRQSYALDDYLVELQNTIRHELRHVVQVMVLPPEQSQKTYTDAGGDDYYTSQIEFDPMIGSEAEEFVSVFKAIQGYGKKINLGQSIRETVGMAKPKLGDRSSPFFLALKRGDPARYRLAVKKFIGEINRLLVGDNSLRG